jgi:hypothetical protein
VGLREVARPHRGGQAVFDAVADTDCFLYVVDRDRCQHGSITRPSIGLTSAKVAPLAAATYCPSMKAWTLIDSARARWCQSMVGDVVEFMMLVACRSRRVQKVGGVLAEMISQGSLPLFLKRCGMALEK